MRIQVFTGLAVGFLVMTMGTQSSAEAMLRADHVVVLKKKRTLELLNHGRVLKTYKVALGGNAVGPKTRQGDHKTRKVPTCWTRGTRTASITNQFIFPTRAHVTGRWRSRAAFRRAAMFSSTDCLMATAPSGLPIGSETGPMVASP